MKPVQRIWSQSAFIALFLFASTAQAIVAAESPLPWTRPYAGHWTLSGVTDGAPYCRLALGTQGVIGGASVEIPATCRRNFPLEEVTAWTLRDDRIVMIDALRQSVLSFARLSEGSYSAKLPNGEMMSLDLGPPAPPKSRRDLLDGTFSLSGPDNAAACGFSVIAKSENRGELEQVGQCPAVWKDKGWKRWDFAAGRLNLRTAAGSLILSLTPDDEFTFIADRPEGPLFFGPGVIVAEP